jgi:hypothetical protein
VLGLAVARSTRAAAQSLATSLPEVTEVDVEEAIAFLAGAHPDYPDASLDSIIDFSAANIVETMDTGVLDEVHARRGPKQLFLLYGVMGFELLEALLDAYGARPVVLALDAGHGGKRGIYYDPGANGTEAVHARGVVAAIEDLATDRRYDSVVIRRIFNDDVGDDFGMPSGYDCDGSGQRLLRNVRASMLRYETERLSGAHAANEVALHVLSVHFNDGANGVLALHQGESVRDSYRERSMDFATAYVERVQSALNAAGLLPRALDRALGTGLSDDRMLYDPPLCYRINPYTGVDQRTLPARYALLQSSLMERDFADGIVRLRGAVT